MKTQKMSDTKKIRIDKWLWAARFFKTRAQVAQGISSGKVHLDDLKIKPSRAVAIGDIVRIKKGVVEFVVIVRAVRGQRRPAVEAALLYEETEASMLARQMLMEQQRLLKISHSPPCKKPEKKDRRLIRKFIRQEGAF